MIANLSGTPSRICQKAVGATSTTLYTAQPDGRTAVLDIVITNTTSGSLNLSLYINTVDAANAFGFYSTAVPANSSVHWSGFQILNINEPLIAVGSATGLTATISGLERV